MAQTVYAAMLWTVILLLSIAVAQAGQVKLSWSASSGATGYQVHYGTSSGNYTASANAGNTTTYTVPNLTDGRTYYFAVRAYDGAGKQSAFSNEVSKTLDATAPPPSGALPSPWLGMDIGNIGVVGSASHSGGTFTLKGSGADIWGTTDAFHFVYQPLTDDGSIVARVVSVGNTARWAKAGVMIRETLDAHARNALALVSPNTGGVFFQYRTSTGGGSVERDGAVVGAPYWVRLTRTGNTITAHQSANGTSWTWIGSVTLSVGSTVYVGLAVTSTNNTALNTTTFDNVSVSKR